MKASEKELTERADKLYEKTTRKALEDISFAAQRLGFKADITLVMELSHKDLGDTTLLHLTGNKNLPEERLFAKAITIINQTFESNTPFQDIAMMANLANMNALGRLRELNSKMSFLETIATAAKKLIDSDASFDEVMSSMLKDYKPKKGEKVQ